MKIEYLPHTADLRMKVEAASLEELFKAGLLGMSQILNERFCQEQEELPICIPITLTASDLTCLMVDFLSEALTISYTKNALFCSMEVIDISESNITANLYGAKNFDLDEEIKAVTYHEARVLENTLNNWETVIVFDI